MARTSLVCALLGSLLVVAGCSSDNNSPEMGAVPPKPNPNVVKQMPAELQEQMKNAESGMKQQAQEQGSMAKSGK